MKLVWYNCRHKIKWMIGFKIYNMKMKNCKNKFKIIKFCLINKKKINPINIEI